VSDKPARIAQLKAEIAAAEAQQQARRDELLRLSRELVADLAGLRGDERDLFMGLTKP
jgi:hypothetical protein